MLLELGSWKQFCRATYCGQINDDDDDDNDDDDDDENSQRHI